MRLAGIWFYDFEGPVHAAFVHLGDVTALVGANDVGKTRLLGLIETVLSHPERSDMVDVFGIASAEEVEAFVDREAPDEFAIQDAVDQVAAYADVLEAPQLEGRVRLGIRLPTHDPTILGAFRYGRCPAELGEPLSSEIQELLPGSGPDPAREPVKLEYLGQIDPAIFPEPVVVPSPLPGLIGEVGQIAGRLCWVLSELAAYWDARELILTPDPEDGFDPEGDDPLDLGSRAEAEDEEEERDPGDPDPDWPRAKDWRHAPETPLDETGDVSWEWLLDEEPALSRVRPVAVLVCQALSQIAAGLVPSFITGEYRLKITPAPPTAIARDDRVRVQLLRLDTAPDWLDEQDGLHINLSDVASGYRLWLELALRETLARARALAHLFYCGVGCLQLAADRELDMSVEDVRSILRAALGHLRDPRTPTPDPEDVATLAWAAQNAPHHPGQDPDPRFFAAPRERIYLIDEPEQRLHPALQRRAARWLTTLMSEWGAQCVLATHTLAFIPTAPNTHAYQLTRTHEPDNADTADIHPLDPSTLTPYAQLAQTVGLDRGELLTRWRAIVFADPLLALVLEGLAGDQLERSHIHIVTVDPADHRPPPEIALLADLTAAPLILLTTNPPPRTQDSHDDQSPPDHLPPATAIQRLATELELTLETIPLPIAHPLDLLHPDAITHSTPRHHDQPAFPGHDHAHHLHTTSPHASLPYPDFLHATYGITTDPVAIAAILQTMRDRDLPPGPQLTDALWHIERTALTAETP